MEKEPVLTVTAITTFVAALIGLAVQFGAPIDESQKDSITAFVIALWPIVTVVWARSKAVSPATDAERSKQAYLDGITGVEPSVPVE